MLKQIRLACILVSLLLPFATPGTAAERELPLRLSAKTPSVAEPLWIAASEAIGPNGNLKPGLFSSPATPWAAGFLKPRGPEVFSTTSADPCAEYRDGVIDERMDPKPNLTLADLRRYALAAYSGTIVATDTGFLAGMPGSLLKLHVERRIRDAVGIDSSEYLYIFYPYARILLKNSVACRTDISFPFRPSVSTRLLVFVYVKPLDQLDRLIIPESSELFFEQSDGTLFVPLALKKDSAANAFETFGELVQFLSGPATEPGRDIPKESPR